MGNERWGNRDVPLPDPDRFPPARSHFPRAEERSPDGLFRHQPDDPIRQADLATSPIKQPSKPPVCPSLDLCTNA